VGDSMKFVSILPVDSYVVINKSVLNDSDYKHLTMLYQPIIGSIAINMYFSLWADLNKTEVMSNEYTHHHLMSNTKLSLDDIVSARRKLEALGLIKTYYKAGDINNYVYELYSPLSVSEFFSNPILSFSLYSSVGKKEYEDLISYFKMPKINFNGFENVSMRFSDIYSITTKNIEDVTSTSLKGKEKLDILVDDFVDFEFISSTTKKSNIKLDDKIKTLINKLAYLYNFDNITISNIIMNSITDKGTISEVELKKNCKNYYLFENKGNIPKLVYKSKSSDKGVVNDKGLRAKLISCFEGVTPYNFLKSKYKGAKPTTKDVTLIEGLLVDQALSPGVINVLIDYVLRVNDKKLNKNLIEAIASQWKMLGINTAEDAMKQAEKEYKKHKTYKENKINKSIKTEKLPHWYGKEIKKEQMTDEEEKELKDMLKEFE
jgi:replication initiation and membrane attachment protein